MKPVESFDRRGFGRRQTNINAQVRIGYRVIPCTIKDLSEGGALLEFAEHTELPQKLWLSWPEQKSEIVCEVRHMRRNTAGVQFLRTQTLSLRPALEPSDPVAVQPAPPPKASERAHSAFDLVAERRRATRPVAETAPVFASPRDKPATLAEPPRDISTLMQSLKAAAQSIIDARAAADVPRPLAARDLAGAAVEPPAPAHPSACPLSLPASLYGFCADAPAASRKTRSLRSIASALQAARRAALVPLPLPAAAYAEAETGEAASVPPAGSAQVPMPLPAHAFAASAELAREGWVKPCDGHPCALAVWRTLGNSPPRPLSAWVYGQLVPRSVA
jgi:hypothetical protein